MGMVGCHPTDNCPVLLYLLVHLSKVKKKDPDLSMPYYLLHDMLVILDPKFTHKLLYISVKCLKCQNCESLQSKLFLLKYNL